MLGIILCLTLSLTACQEEETLKIGLLKIDDSIPFYVAEQEGLFEKYGVNVELVSFGSGQAQATAIEADEIDGMMTDMVVQGLLLKGGTNLKVVSIAFGAAPEEGRFLVVSSPNSNILEPKDLLGANLAISTNTMMDFLVEQFETIYELDSDQINKVNMPNLMLRVEALIEGKDITAAILPDPLASYAVSSGANVVIDDTKVGLNLSQSVVAMTKDSLDNNTLEVEKMLKAYWEAMTLLNKNPDKYRELCLEAANVPSDISEVYPTPSYTPYLVPSEENVKRVSDWLLERELITNPYSYADIVDDKFIK